MYAKNYIHPDNPTMEQLLNVTKLYRQWLG